jgi:NADH-quinone oxidoreductase subunit A
MLFYQEYSSIFFFLLVSVVLGFIVLFLAYSVSVYNPDSEKLSAYECGFDPYEDARNVFDVRFYIIAILFLVFDLEAAYIYPWCASLSCLNNSAFWGMLDFIFELLVGLVYAWSINALEWE